MTSKHTESEKLARKLLRTLTRQGVEHVSVTSSRLSSLEGGVINVQAKAAFDKAKNETVEHVIAAFNREHQTARAQFYPLNPL